MIVPASTKALTRARPFIPGAYVSPYPLRCFDGRTWAERAAERDALAKDIAA